jgi:hypothetical protein
VINLDFEREADSEYRNRARHSTRLALSCVHGPGTRGLYNKRCYSMTRRDLSMGEFASPDAFVVLFELITKYASDSYL